MGNPDDTDYSDMSGAASEQPVTSRPSSGSHTGSASAGMEPKRLVVIAMVLSWALAIAVMFLIDLPLWIIATFAVVDGIAIFALSRTTFRPGQSGNPPR